MPGSVLSRSDMKIAVVVLVDELMSLLLVSIGNKSEVSLSPTHKNGKLICLRIKIESKTRSGLTSNG